MPKDTRDRNIYFHSAEIHRYLKEYAGAIAHGLSKIDENELEKAKDLLRLTLARSGRIFVGGNGGSQAISDHLCCDFMKGTASDTHNNLIVHALHAPSLTSAIGNDLGYDQTLAYPLDLYRCTSSDLVILISSSGNSPNVVKALDLCNMRGVAVIGLSGFDGGALKKRSDVSLHVPFNNYGVVEDCHQALMHVLAQWHYLSFKNGK